MSLRILVLCALCVLTSCSIVSSGPPTTPTNPHVPDGVAYYLPTSYVKLIATNQPKPAPPAPKSGEGDKGGGGGGNAGSGGSGTQSTLAGDGGTPATSSRRPSTSRGEKPVTPPPAPPSPGAPAQPLVDRVELLVLAPVPDTRRIYVAKTRHWAQRDDDVTISTTPSGLLEKLTITTHDRSGDALVNLAKAAVKVAEFVVAPPTTTLASERCTSYSDTYVFDPTSAEDIHRVNAALDQRKCSPFQIDVQPLDGTLACRYAQQDVKEEMSKLDPALPEADRFAAACELLKKNPGGPGALPSEVIDGIYYRRPSTYRFEAVARDANFAELFQSLSGGPVFSLSYASGFLVQRKYEAQLEHGQLKSSTRTDPSEIMAFATLPLTLLEAISDSLGSLLTVEVKNEGQEQTPSSDAQDEGAGEKGVGSGNAEVGSTGQEAAQ